MPTFLRVLALFAMLFGAWTLIRRTGLTLRERRALVLIIVATTLIVAGVVVVALQESR